MNATKTNNLKALPIFLAFLCMGFGDVVGPMVGLAKDSFSLSNFSAQLLSFTGFIMFAVLSIPVGIYQDKKGKKFILLLGLFIAFIGLIIPILNGMYGPRVEFSAESKGEFYIILLSLLLLGAGATILQVSGNPLMRDVSAPGKYSSNLSLAQSVKAIGSSLGFLLPPLLVIAFDMDWSILFPVYTVLIFITILWISATKIQEKKETNAVRASLRSSFKLLGNGYVLMMVLTIFFYVGAEVSMSSQVPILMKEVYGIANVGLWVSWALFFLPILLGRFLGSLILRILSPPRFLMITVVLAIAGILLLLFGNQVLAFTGIVLVGLGFANIFPLVFSITVEKMPERTNELSGLMVTAIAGGAIIPPITGAVADVSSVLLGFIVPLVILGYIVIVAYSNLKKG
ncbi:MAG: MFS transporter [Bacteroidales bacterium]|nr:MFS transporter [Bacteroidales bacterium]